MVNEYLFSETSYKFTVIAREYMSGLVGRKVKAHMSLESINKNIYAESKIQIVMYIKSFFWAVELQVNDFMNAAHSIKKRKAS